MPGEGTRRGPGNGMTLGPGRFGNGITLGPGNGRDGTGYNLLPGILAGNAERNTGEMIGGRNFNGFGNSAHNISGITFCKNSERV